MSLRPALAKAFGLAAALSWTVQGAAFGQAFPRSAVQPSPYSASPYSGPASRPLAGAPQAPVIQQNGAQTVRVDLGSGGSQTRMMSLPRGKSAVIELPADARDVLVSDPKVADVVLSTPRRIYVLGVGAGQTDAVFFDAAGRQLLNLNIRVDQDISSLSSTMNRILPGASVRIEALNDSLILSGGVASLSDADKAVQLARSMVSAPEKVVNMLSIASPDQVMLKVRIVEVDRTVIKQLGFNLNAIYNAIGEPQLKFGLSQGFGVNGSLLGGVSTGYDLDTTKVPTLQVPCAPGLTGDCLAVTRNIGDAINYNTATATDVAGKAGLNQAEAMLQAFERVGLVRTLAEPNLTAVSGEAAKFLAGGEFPVPTGRDTNGQVTVEFKPYGVGLGFTPVVLSEGRISIKISTEYSEITNIGALTIGNGAGTSGTTVPGLNVRRAETMVELPSGGAMMIAGLLQSTTKSTIDSVPGLMQLPVLGALFRSRDFLNNESELVVIVTPYLVKSTSPDKLQTPADGLQIASDMQTVLLGRLNRASGRSPDKSGATFQGPYGYVVD
ncbi:MAG: pilus assembly protein CpaC [Caulobacterales bacterium 32-69-10]|nr:MAG: pilus assembly protein CpaC [Caulobacterales bacterium 32-69-10]